MYTMNLKKVSEQLSSQGFSETKFNEVLNRCNTYIKRGQPESISVENLKSTLTPKEFRTLSSNVPQSITY